MKNKSHLIVVESEVLPEVIIKVLEVKKLLANKEEKSSAAACKRVGVSRSAYINTETVFILMKKSLCRKS